MAWQKCFHIINAYGLAERAQKTALNINAYADTGLIQIGGGVGVITWVVYPKNDDGLSTVGQIGELFLEGPLSVKECLDDA